MLKHDEKIPMTTLYITPNNGFENAFYVDSNDTDDTNRNKFIIEFSQETVKPDHCIYFALQEMGMKNIPVYVNNDSYEIGKMLGIFE